MKHKITFDVKREKKGLFGITRTVTERKTVEVDGDLYRKLKKQEKRSKELNKQIAKKEVKKHKPYTIDEMMFYDDIFGD